MAFFDKIGDFAKNVGEKTGDALETGKLQMKVRSEKGTIEDNYKKLGQFYYERYVADGTVDEEAKEYTDAIDAANENIKNLENEIAEIKKGEEKTSDSVVVDSTAKDVSTPTAGKFCSNCGNAVQQAGKFCANCGTSIE